MGILGKEVTRGEFLKGIGLLGGGAVVASGPVQKGLRYWEIISSSHKDKNLNYPLDVIVVLGAGTEKKNGATVLNKYGKIRAIAAAHCFRQGLASRLLFIDGEGEYNPIFPPSRAYLDRIYKKDEGKQSKIPKENTIFDVRSFNTATNMNLLSQLIEKNHWQRVGVLTNTFHLPRTMILAENYGIDIVPVSAEEKLVERDKRFAPVVNRIYSSSSMKLAIAKELAGIALLTIDPKAQIQIGLSRLAKR